MATGGRSSRPTPSQFELHRLVGVATVLALVLLIVIWFYPKSRSTTNQNTNRSKAAVPVIEMKNFTDVIGQVVQVDPKTPNIVLQTSGSRVPSTPSYEYQIALTPDTSLQSYRVADTSGTTQDLAVADIHPKDILHVYANENLYHQSTFTATRIVKLIQD